MTPLPHERHDERERGESSGDEIPRAVETGWRTAFHPVMRMQARLAEMTRGELELHEPEHHAHAGGGESVVPVEPLAEKAAHERPDGGTEIYAHVEDGEARIAARPALGIKVADHDAHVRLEQSRADDDENQAEEKSRRARDREREMSGGDNDAANPNGTLRAEQPVADPAAGQRDHINERGVESVDGGGGLVIETEPAVLHGIDHE